MKSTFTLTRTCLFAFLLIASSATFAFSTDGSRCKTKCCKTNAEKSIIVSMAKLEAMLEEMSKELQTITVVATAKSEKNARKIFRVVRFTPFISSSIIVDPGQAVVETEASHQINFNDLENEMNKVQIEMSELKGSGAEQKINFESLQKEMNDTQEKLSQMDASLKADDAKTRKAAEEILKTGIKS